VFILPLCYGVIVGLVPTIHNHCLLVCMDVRHKGEHDTCKRLGVILKEVQDLFVFEMLKQVQHDARAKQSAA
jgi:hypothetical protein